MNGLRRARTAALITAVALFAAVGVVLLLTTPWESLPGEPPGGAVRPDPTSDFSPAELARSAAFDAALNPPVYLDLVIGLAAVLVLGLTPWGARFLGRCTARVARRPLRLIVAVVALTTLLWAIGLPFDVWRENVLRRYGLSTQTWSTWSVDQLKSLGLRWVMWTVIVLLLFALARRLPRYWWTAAAAGGFALVVAVSFLYPLVVEPVFNTFRPLPAGTLRTDLLRMADRDGVPVKDVLVADASRRTTSLNAYVSGFGSTRRIVVYDTLLKSPPARVESIVAHELGHAKRNDVLYGTLVGALGTSGAVCLLYLVLTSPGLRRRAGLTSEGDAADADARSVALLLAAVVVLTQVSGPVHSLVSRQIEARADAHALALTRDPATFVSMQHELSVRNMSDLRPNPLEYVLWFSHPSGPERIAMARTWARLHGVPEPPARRP
ncbi:M48 family metallopeptidase [Thermomonospora umbrina]|uniref:STE24 endopeptidase n=1 Tax=Thermomonospora umbrina TaxID=111806 RepID=A0A3D9SU63_9ACTN|nr:M48 family metallopeptidase [Thermomonospora umbrina]REE99509.1 STE24 endopeptidase [Thermomonospora umbrina]